MRTKALVVDDNFYNRDLARLALENAGFVVDEAENGLEALKVLEAQNYDLLILDLAMPELDGRGVINELQKSLRHKEMKIVVVTAHAHMADVVALDADFVMHKPINITEFVTFLTRLRAIH